MSDLVKEISDYVKNKVPAILKIYQDVLPGITSEEISVRHEATPTNTRTYFDGTQIGTLHFTFYLKSKTLATVQNNSSLIADALNVSKVGLKNNLELNIVQLSEPYFVEQLETKELIYTLPFEINYTKR